MYAKRCPAATTCGRHGDESTSPVGDTRLALRNSSTVIGQSIWGCDVYGLGSADGPEELFGKCLLMSRSVIYR